MDKHEVKLTICVTIDINRIKFLRWNVMGKVSLLLTLLKSDLESDLPTTDVNKNGAARFMVKLIKAFMQGF